MERTRTSLTRLPVYCWLCTLTGFSQDRSRTPTLRSQVGSLLQCQSRTRSATQGRGCLGKQLAYKNLELGEAYSVMGRKFALVEYNHQDTKHTDTDTFTVTLCTAISIKLGITVKNLGKRNSNTSRFYE